MSSTMACSDTISLESRGEAPDRRCRRSRRATVAAARRRQEWPRRDRDFLREDGATAGPEPERLRALCPDPSAELLRCGLHQVDLDHHAGVGRRRALSRALQLALVDERPADAKNERLPRPALGVLAEPEPVPDEAIDRVGHVA
jgi:hypothetical protein